MKLKGFQKLTLIEEALHAWMNVWQIDTIGYDLVPLQEALGRVLAEEIVAKESLPRFDKSAMDGYAVKSLNTTGASQSKPIKLLLTEKQEITDGQAKQIWTGNPIPKGADAVVIIEETKKSGDNLEVWCQVIRWQNVSKVGEDIKAGTPVANIGTRVSPYHIGLAAALGFSKLKVAKKPRIALIATGNELAEVGTKLTDNLIYDSNKVMISSECKELGAQTIDFGIVKDNMDEIANKIKEALQTCDAVITTGGTSVGGLDLVPDVVNKQGKPGVIVHGVALRPAMPTAVAVLENKPVLILSGNPVAAVIGFEVFGRAMICRMLGMTRTEPRFMVKATLTRRVASALGRKTYVRVHVSNKDGEFFAEPVSAKGSGSISTMTQSNGFVIVPENREGITEGELVVVHLFGVLEVSS